MPIARESPPSLAFGRDSETHRGMENFMLSKPRGFRYLLIGG